ncbi:MAG: hypothetical protein ACXAD7_01895 [Candidatus Kariarchaeaceae archaeon]|jgi:heme/copper-type cytochrome/quinol oxidase subunit 2
MNPKILVLIPLLVLPVIAFNSQPAVADGSDPVKSGDEKYHIKIITSQWEFVAVDLNTSKEYKHRIGSFEKGSNIVFEIVSKDVQHGFSINELDLAVATNRPLPGEVEGAPTFVEVVLPDEDITLSAFCHIFCGLGHPDMKIKFVVGEGSFEAGKYVFWGVIALNVIIFSIIARSIFLKANGSEPVTS